jgi:hypothetical protein
MLTERSGYLHATVLNTECSQHWLYPLPPLVSFNEAATVWGETLIVLGTSRIIIFKICIGYTRLYSKINSPTWKK